MKKWLIIVFVLFMCGCSLDLMTKDNPLGFRDPNQGPAIIGAGQGIAQTGQVVGTATGNPLIYGISALGGAIIYALGQSYIKKGKKK